MVIIRPPLDGNSKIAWLAKAKVQPTVVGRLQTRERQKMTCIGFVWVLYFDILTADRFAKVSKII